MRETIKKEAEEVASAKNVVTEQQHDDDTTKKMNNNGPSTSSSPPKPPKFWNQNRIGLIIFTSLFTFLYCGAFLGWGPMQLILEKDGAFDWKCDNDDFCGDVAQTCPEQSKALMRIPMIAYSCAVAFSPLLGYLSDSRGPLALMIFLAISGCIGIGFNILASLTYDQLYYIGFTFIGYMFVSVSIIIVPTGLVFKANENAQRLVISFLHALIDAGSVTYLILLAIVKSVSEYEQTSTTVKVMSGYLALAVLSFGGGIYYWLRITKTDDDGNVSKDSNNDNGGDVDKSKIVRVVEPNDVEAAAPGTTTAFSESKAAIVVEETTIKEADESNKSSSSSSSEQQPPQVVATDHETLSMSKSSSSSSSSSSYILISKRLPMDQLKSLHFILVLLFFMFHVTRANFTLQVARDWLGSLGDDEHQNKYLTIFSILNAVSLVGIPFIDWVLTKKGYHAGFQLVNIMGLVHGLIQVTSNNLNVQIVGFVVYSFYRCYLFSVVFSYLPVFLSGNVVGRAAGIMFICTSILATSNIGLSSWAVNQSSEGGNQDDDPCNNEEESYNFFGPNLYYTIIIGPLLIVAWFIGKGIQQEEQGKKQQQQQQQHGGQQSPQDGKEKETTTTKESDEVSASFGSLTLNGFSSIVSSSVGSLTLNGFSSIVSSSESLVNIMEKETTNHQESMIPQANPNEEDIEAGKEPSLSIATCVPPSLQEQQLTSSHQTSIPKVFGRRCRHEEVDYKLSTATSMRPPSRIDISSELGMVVPPQGQEEETVGRHHKKYA